MVYDLFNVLLDPLANTLLRVLFEECLFISTFWLLFCICFCGLGKSLLSPVLVGWSYVVGVLWDPVGQSP